MFTIRPFIVESLPSKARERPRLRSLLVAAGGGFGRRSFADLAPVWGPLPQRCRGATSDLRVGISAQRRYPTPCKARHSILHLCGGLTGRNGELLARRSSRRAGIEAEKLQQLCPVQEAVR